MSETKLKKKRVFTGWINHDWTKPPFWRTQENRPDKHYQNLLIDITKQKGPWCDRVVRVRVTVEEIES